jgi:hypothetical protein
MMHIFQCEGLHRFSRHCLKLNTRMQHVRFIMHDICKLHYTVWHLLRFRMPNVGVHMRFFTRASAFKNAPKTPEAKRDKTLSVCLPGVASAFKRRVAFLNIKYAHTKYKCPRPGCDS